MPRKTTKKTPAKKTSPKKQKRSPKKAATRGRPSKLTPTLAKVVFAALERHCRTEDACQAAGITLRTFQLWRQKARKGEEPYASFFDECEIARANARIELASLMRQGKNIKGEQDWKAIDRLAGRLHPELAVAEVSRRAVEMEVERLFVEMEDHLSPEERTAMYTAYAKVRGIST